MLGRALITALVWLRRLVLVGGWLALTVLMLAAVALWWLTSTSSGVQWSFDQVEQRLSALTVEHVEGTPWRGLRLEGLAWQPQEGAAVEAAELRLEIDPGALWRGQLRLADLFVRDMLVDLPPAGEDAAGGPDGAFDPDDLPLPPWLVEVESLRAESVVIRQGERDTRVETAQLTALLDARVDRPRLELDLAELALEMPDAVRLDGRGEIAVELAGSMPAIGRIELLMDHPAGWLSGHVDVEGEALAGLALRPTLDWIGADGQPAAACGAMTLEGADLAISNLVIDALGGRLALDGAAQLAADWSLRLAGRGESVDPAWITPGLPGDLDFGVSIDVSRADGWLPVAGRLAIDRLDGELAGERLEAIDIEGDLASDLVTLGVDGRAGGGDLRLDARLDAERGFEADWRIEALPVAAALFDGQRPALVFASDGRVHGRLPDWEQPLSAADWLAQSRLELEALRAVLAESGVEGEPRRLQLDAQGHLADGEATLSRGELTMPGARLEAGGRLATAAELDDWLIDDGRLQLSVPDLGALPWDMVERVPGVDLAALGTDAARGAIDADVDLAGPLLDPHGRLELTARSLVLAGHSLGELAVDGRIGGPEANDDLRLSLEAADLRAVGAEERLIDRLSIRADGTPEAHRLRMDADAMVGLRLVADGGWDGAQWQGRLDRLDLSRPDVGDWALAEPATLTIDAQRQRLETFCLRPVSAGMPASETGRLCLDADRDPETVNARASGDLSLMALWQQWPGADPETLELPGRLQVDGTARLAAGVPSADIGIDLPASEIRLAGDAFTDDSSNDEFEVITYRPARLEVRLDGEQVEGGLQAGLEDWLDLSAAGRADLADRQIEGDVDLARADLARLVDLFESLVGPTNLPVGDITGDLRGQASVTGDWADPRVAASLRLRDFGLAAFAAGTEYRDGRIDAELASDGGITLAGSLVGEADTPPRPVFQERRITETESSRTRGELALSGEGRFDAPGDWRLALEVGGEAVPVLRLPTMTVDARPDLQLDLAPSGGRLDGAIHVPLVIANIEELPESARSNSPDLVIVGEEEPDPGSAYPIEGDVDVVLGDDVSLRGHGFATRLAGGLELRIRPDQTVDGFGEVRLEDGRYQAYGQDLRIERGRLIFNGPLGAPGLDVVASRQIDDAERTVVGLSIQGELENPETEVFSEPATSQSDALSLLLTGRRLSDGSEGDGSLLMAAIKGLGVRGGDTLAQQVNATLGFDEIGLDSGDDVSGTRLSVGKRIGENLLVRYAVGVFDGVGEVITRYRINRFLHLELTSSAESQSGDLIYQIDTGRRED
ncbi:MAG: translocation/assembly module TamB domain-containing protein [Guyparkeria sp.]